MAEETGRHRTIILRLHKNTGRNISSARTPFQAFFVHLHHSSQDAKTWLLFFLIPSLRSPLGQWTLAGMRLSWKDYHILKTQRCAADIPAAMPEMTLA